MVIRVRHRAARAPARAEGEAAGFAPTAEAGGGFGAMGQLVLSLGGTADEHFFFHKSGGAWELHVAPSGDYFIAPRFSVGGVLAFDHSNGGGGTNSQGTDTLRLAPRVGYSFDFNDRFGVWPLGGLAFGLVSFNHNTSLDTWLTLYVPFPLHLAPHFFVARGRRAQLHLSGDGGNEWGLDSLMGGWF